jgi:hypothetical protein
MEPSHSDAKLPQKMLGKRYGFELMRLFTIGDGDWAYCGRCHWVSFLVRGRLESSTCTELLLAALNRHLESISGYSINRSSRG